MLDDVALSMKGDIIIKIAQIENRGIRGRVGFRLLLRIKLGRAPAHNLLLPSKKNIDPRQNNGVNGV